MARASLCRTFGSKDGLIAVYLERQSNSTVRDGNILLRTRHGTRSCPDLRDTSITAGYERGRILKPDKIYSESHRVTGTDSAGTHPGAPQRHSQIYRTSTS